MSEAGVLPERTTAEQTITVWVARFVITVKAIAPEAAAHTVPSESAASVTIACLTIMHFVETTPAESLCIECKQTAG